MAKINIPIHLNSSSSDQNVIRGIVHADNYYIWSNNQWIPYSQSITSLTGTFYGNGSGLSGIVASASVDWSNVSATGIFKGDGSGLTGIVASASVDWSNISATGIFEGDGSGLSGVSGTDTTYYNYRLDSGEPNGFTPEDRLACSISTTTSSRTFGISPTGSSYSFWSKGNKYTNIATKETTWQDINGIHHFYFDETGTLRSSTGSVLDILRNYAYISNLYWNKSVSAIVGVGDERHGMIMDHATHEYLHRTAGAVYVSGLNLGDFHIGTNATFSVSDGIFFDEDIEHIITDGSPQTLSTTAWIPVYSLTGTGIWQKSVSANYGPVIQSTTGNNRIVYNATDGSTWWHKEVANNDYVLAHIWATNDIYNPIICIMGQNNYTTIGQARIGANTEIANLIGYDMPFTEFIPLGTIIYQTNTSWAAPKARSVLTDTGANYIDWTVSNISSGTPPSDHGLLTGLANDDHVRYWDLNTIRVANPSLSGNLSITGSVNANSISGLGDGIPHSSLSALLNNDHPQYSLSSHVHNQYALTSSLSSYALTSSLSEYSLTSHIHPYLPLSGGVVTGLVNFTSGLTSSYVLIPDGDSDNPTIQFTSPDNRTGFYKFGDYGIGMVGNGSIITFEKNTISANTANFYIEDIYAEDIYSNSVSTNTTWSPTIYCNDHYYMSNLSNVNHYCSGDYYFNFEGAGVYIQSGLTSLQNVYINDSLYVANSISGLGDGIPHSSLSGLLNNDHPQYSLSAHTHNYLPIGGGTLTGDLDLGNNDITNIGTLVATLSISSTDIYASNLHGANSDNLQIRAGAVNKIISFDYGSGVEVKDQPLSAIGNFQTNLITSITNDDPLLITAAQNIDMHSGKILTLSANQEIEIKSDVAININNNTMIQGSLSAQSISGYINSNGGFVLENRTSDPASPTIGQIWFRSDL